MARRVGAMLGIVVILLLITGLVLAVHEHREKGRDHPEDLTVVSLSLYTAGGTNYNLLA